MTTGEPLDVALVGIGRRGWDHLALLLSTPGLRLAAICDRDPARLAEASRLAGPDVLATTRLEELIQARPAFAVVCTLPLAQAPIATSLLEAGIPAMLEVPPGFDGQTIRELLDTAARHSLPLGSLENYSRTPIERFKQALIHSGALGKLERCEIAGSIGHKGHEMAVARRYIGENAGPLRARATRVGGFQRHSGEGIALPQGLSGCVEFEGGVEAAFELRGVESENADDLASADLRSDFRAEHGGCRDNRLFLIREGQEVEARLQQTNRRVGDSLVPETLRLAELPEVVWTNPLADVALPKTRLIYFDAVDPTPHSWEIAQVDCYLDMAAAVREGRPAEYGVEYSLLDVRIRLAMIESTRRGGEWVDWQEELFPVESEIRRSGWKRFLQHHPWLQPIFAVRARLVGRA